MAEEIEDIGASEETDQDSDPFAGTPLEGVDLEDSEQGSDDEVAEEEGATSDEEALIPLDQLPPELRPHQAKMTKIYNERLKGIREQERKIEAFDRFMNDPEYQRDFLQNAARQLGMELRPAGNNGQQANQQQSRDSASDFTSKARGILEANPEWRDFAMLAEPIAMVAKAMAEEEVQNRLSPYEQQQANARKEQQEAEFDQMTDQLSEVAPGWEDYEDDMASLWQFIDKATKGGPRIHPKFGNVLHMMYRLVTGDAQATAQAGRRMRSALTARDTTSRGSQAARPNIRDLIDKAEDSDSKWEMAFNDAVRRNRRR